jgi:hypothetical protein
MADALPPEVVAQAAARRLGLGQQRDTSLQRLGDTYNESTTNLNKFADEGNRRISDDMAARGLFQSGMRVDQQGKLQQNVAQRRGLLSSNYGTSQRDVENQYQTGLQGILDWQNQMAGQQQQTSLQQQLVDAQNASTMQQAQANQLAMSGGGGGGAPAQPSQADIDAWNLAMWNNAMWNNAMMQNQQLQQYQGGVGRVM